MYTHHGSFYVVDPRDNELTWFKDWEPAVQYAATLARQVFPHHYFHGRRESIWCEIGSNETGPSVNGSRVKLDSGGTEAAYREISHDSGVVGASQDGFSPVRLMGGCDELRPRVETP